jgi:hypothetical protein
MKEIKMFAYSMEGLLVVTVALSRNKRNEKEALLLLMRSVVFISKVNRWHLMLWGRNSYHF